MQALRRLSLRSSRTGMKPHLSLNHALQRRREPIGPAARAMGSDGGAVAGALWTGTPRVCAHRQPLSPAGAHVCGGRRSRKLTHVCSGEVAHLGEGREGFSFQEGRFQGESCEEAREGGPYVHLNPVKEKLVENGVNWIWSSFAFYETGTVGLVRIDVVD